MPLLSSQAYQVSDVVDAILALKHRANLRRQPNVRVRQLPKRIEQHLCTTPRRGRRRDVEDEGAVDATETAIDVSFVGQVLFEQPNPHPRQCSLQRVEPSGQFHIGRVGRRWRPRNLEIPKARLLRCGGCDSPGETVDWRG